MKPLLVNTHKLCATYCFKPLRVCAVITCYVSGATRPPLFLLHLLPDLVWSTVLTIILRTLEPQGRCQGF